MRTTLLFSAVTLIGLSPLAGGQVNAQVRNPAVSPWLNLNRTGASAAINYYDLVRPQVDFRSGIQVLGQESRVQQAEIAGVAGQLAFPATGHRTLFFSHQRYFLNNFGGAAGGTGRGLGGLGANAGLRPIAPATLGTLSSYGAVRP
jgi:hypothetical protein